MKLILTENQFNSLLRTEGVAQFLQESLNESKNFENLKKIVKRLLIAGIAASTIIAVINKSNVGPTEKEILINAVAAHGEDSEDIKSDAPVIDTIFQKKVDACRAYMEKALTNQGYSMDSTKLKPETLVQVSMDKSFDLPFLMAVAHQESCFGATPRAQRTNSVFSEGSWDNGVNKVTYSDPNDSVEGYIDLLNKSYIVNGKTLLDLLKPNSFVNSIGKRYAKDEKYEAKIKWLRNRIIINYPELTSI